MIKRSLCTTALLVLLLTVVTGCERKTKNYAGIQDSKQAPYTESVDPQRVPSK